MTANCKYSSSCLVRCMAMTDVTMVEEKDIKSKFRLTCCVVNKQLEMKLQNS